MKRKYVNLFLINITASAVIVVGGIVVDADAGADGEANETLS